MRSRYLVKTLVMFSAAVLMSSSAWAQATKSWSAPRTPWGDPDIQGRWPANDMQGTPYQRPESFGTRATLNDKEFAEREAARERQVRADGEVLRAARSASRYRRSIALECRRTWQPAAPGIARCRSAERAHSADDRRGQEAIRPRAQHLLLRLPRCRRRAPVRDVRRPRSVRSMHHARRARIDAADRATTSATRSCRSRARWSFATR